MTAVIITRLTGRSGPLAAVLEANGLRVYEIPTIATASLADTTELDRVISTLDSYDWLVVTSAHGASVVGDRLRSDRPGITANRPWIAAVGPATAGALAAIGAPADLVADEASWSALAFALATPTSVPARILLLRADAARSELPAALRRADLTVDDVVAYRTLEAPESSREPLRAALADPELGCVVVASGSAVRGLVTLADQVSMPLAVPLVAIGPRTAAVAIFAGFTEVRTAAKPTADGLLAAVLETISTLGWCSGVPA